MMLKGIFCVVIGFIFLASSPVYNKPINVLSGQEMGLAILGIVLFIGGLVAMIIAAGGKKKPKKI